MGKHCAECDAAVYAGGLCRPHYLRLKRRGTTDSAYSGYRRGAARVCTLCGDPHHARGLCRRHYQKAMVEGGGEVEPVRTSSQAPPVRLERDGRPVAVEISAAAGEEPATARGGVLVLLGAAIQFRRETGRGLAPEDIEAAARLSPRKGRRLPPLQASRTRHAPQVSISPDAWEEAAEISRGLGLRVGLRGGRSATAGIRALLQAAAFFREISGRPLSPQDINQQARRVASRRRRGASNG